MTPVAQGFNNNNAIFSKAFDYAVYPVLIQFKNQDIYYNQSFKNLLLGFHSKLDTLSWLELVHPHDRLKLRAQWNEFEIDQHDFSVECRLWIEREQCFQDFLLDFQCPDDQIIEWMLQITPQTTQQAQHDTLTGLLNRHSFQQQLEQDLQSAQYTHQALALILLDVDYFRHINEVIGHDAGDYVLSIFAQRLQQHLKYPMTIARLGNDEFAILLPNYQDPKQIYAVADIAQQQLQFPIVYQNQTLSASLSLGCAIYPEHSQQACELWQYAETALHDIKTKGRGGLRIFHPHMREHVHNCAHQLNLARRLLREKAILPYYQPKVRLSDGQVIGFEALLRWKDEQNNIHPPALISEAFTDYELATHISEAMHMHIFEDISQWLKQKRHVLPISINAAPVEFLRDHYAETLLARLKAFQIPHHLIEVEITEQSLMDESAPYVIRALKKLKHAGLRISLDDFGTGHSSLTRLKDYPVDCIKIDRSFIERMHQDPSILAIVRAIGQLGPSMSLDILAEGIELSEQLQTLKDCACDIGQGFYFYHPMNFQHITELLVDAA